MNNKLLIGAFATMFSGISLVAEQAAPTYSMLPIDKQMYCENLHTENCQKYATLFFAAQEAMEKTGVPHLTETEAAELEELFQAIVQEMEPKDNVMTIQEKFAAQIAAEFKKALEREKHELAQELEKHQH